MDLRFAVAMEFTQCQVSCPGPGGERSWGEAIGGAPARVHKNTMSFRAKSLIVENPSLLRFVPSPIMVPFATRERIAPQMLAKDSSHEWNGSAKSMILGLLKSWCRAVRKSPLR
jgi:hypothetical protein